MGRSILFKCNARTQLGDRDFDLLHLVGLLREALHDEEDDLKVKLKHWKARKEDFLDARDFELPVPASRVECREMAFKMKTLFKRQMKRLVKEQEDKFCYIKEKMLVYERMQRVLEAHQEEHYKTSEGVDAHSSHKYLVDSDLKEMKETVNKHKQRLKEHEKKLLRTRLRQMIREQPDEIQDWFIEEYIELNKTHKKESCDLNLPPEVTSNIYASLDVETCVALREVSRSWYTGFQNSDFVFKKLLKERNPWLIPEGDITTWGECVRVFVARLEWPDVPFVNDIEVDEKKEQVENMEAVELGIDEKLPTGFTGLKLLDGQFQFKQRYMRDLKTLETTQDSQEMIVVREDENEKVFRYKDIEITLPAGSEPIEITIGATTVSVVLNEEDEEDEEDEDEEDGHILIMPRDKPHFKHAVITDISGEMEEKGPLVVIRGETVYGNWYYLTDFENKQKFKYPSMTTSTVAAVYQGLVWWRIGDTLSPTFIDLRDPDFIYYNRERTTTGVSTKKFKQGTGNAKNLTMCRTDTGMQVVNLTRGVITNVEFPEEEMEKEAAYLIPGFLGGKLCVRYLTEATQEEIIREVTV